MQNHKPHTSKPLTTKNTPAKSRARNRESKGREPFERKPKPPVSLAPMPWVDADQAREDSSQ